MQSAAIFTKNHNDFAGLKIAFFKSVVVFFRKLLFCHLLLGSSLLAQTTENRRAAFIPSPNAEVLWRSPRLNNRGVSDRKVLDAWAVERGSSSRTGGGVRWLSIPPQTGRGSLADEKFGLDGEILLKGTGLNADELHEVEKIRFDAATGNPMSADGTFTVREALIDIENSRLLSDRGVLVSEPMALISLHRTHPTNKSLLGIYARRFISQTRISNLELMSDLDVRRAMDAAADALYRRGITGHRLNRVEHFDFLLKRMAETAAILQSVQYEHRYIHSQQMTLAGELVDLGTGDWIYSNDPVLYARPDTISYFNFFRQPLWIQNMLFRTHKLRAPQSDRLAEESESFVSQKSSLLAALRRIDPDSAKKMGIPDLEKRFWAAFDQKRDELKIQKSPRRSLKDVFSGSWADYAERYGIILPTPIAEKTQAEFENWKSLLGMSALPDQFVKSHFSVPNRERVDTSVCGNSVRRLSTVR